MENVAVEWKESNLKRRWLQLLDHFDSTKNELRTRFMELEKLENEIESSDLEVVKRMIEEKLKELELAKDHLGDLEMLIKEQNEELAVKKKQCWDAEIRVGEIEKRIAEESKKLNCLERAREDKSKMVQAKDEELKRSERKLDRYSEDIVLKQFQLREILGSIKEQEKILSLKQEKMRAKESEIPLFSSYELSENNVVLKRSRDSQLFSDYATAVDGNNKEAKHKPLVECLPSKRSKAGDSGDAAVATIGASKPSAHPSHGRNSHNSSNQRQQVVQNKFWTCCPGCKVYYQYFKEFENTFLRCQICRKPFVANDLSVQFQAVHPESVMKQFRLEHPSRGVSNVDYDNMSNATENRNVGHDFVSPLKRSRDGQLSNTSEKKKENAVVDGSSDSATGSSVDGLKKLGISGDRTVGWQGQIIFSSRGVYPVCESAEVSFNSSSPMECNKEEAVRAMQLSEKKMQSTDYTGAKKMAEKAQRLFPELENIEKLLAVCEVHCSSEEKIGGSEMDWYGILQIQKHDNDVTIKKQYRKLALLLHPDKNKFVGAEAAYKLVGEANMVLADQIKRSTYDMKCRAVARTGASKPSFHPSKGNLFVRKNNDTASNSQTIPQSKYTSMNRHQQMLQNTFWTCCPDCKVKYQDFKEFANKLLYCQRCRKAFVAVDLGIQVQAVRPTNQFPKEPPSQGTSNVALQSNGGKNDIEHDVGVGMEGAKIPKSGLVKPKNSNISRSTNKKRGRNHAKQNVAAPLEYCLPSQRSKTGEVRSGPDSNVTSISETLEVPDPEFHKFLLDKDSFSANQTWALYDSVDGLPRFYARIREVFSPGFKLRITWLDANPDDEAEIAWCKENLPVACGKHILGNSDEVTDHRMFSHQVHCIKGSGKSSFLVYPRKGETWALYQNWDIGWTSEPEKHEPYKFDFVEVLSDFDENEGVGVAYLVKVEGFVSLFRRSALHGVVSFLVPPNELYRFSHQTPSFRMTGAERDGVPKGSFEFDPASLPIEKSQTEKKCSPDTSASNVEQESENENKHNPSTSAAPPVNLQPSS